MQTILMNKKNGRSGFTLIELLTVIGIIAVLAAILFPVIAKAGRAVKKTKCQSQMQQIITAVEMYKLDNGRAPYALMPYDPAADRDLNDTSRGVADAHGPLLGKYVMDATVFHCPMAMDTEDMTRGAYGNGTDDDTITQTRTTASGEEFKVIVYKYSTYDGNFRAIDPDSADGAELPITDYRYQIAYNPTRFWTGSTPSPNERRNVWRKEWDMTTVVTWCPYHRDYKSGMGAMHVPSGGSMDLVGFLDKKVVPIPTKTNLPPTNTVEWGFVEPR